MAAVANVYTPSKKLGGGPAAVHVGGATLAIFGGLIYSLLAVLIPCPGLAPSVMVFGFGALIGWGIGWIARTAHCRNGEFVTLAGLLWGTLGVYVSWVVFEWLVVGRQNEELLTPLNLFALAASPRAVWDVAVAINESGWFTVRGVTPKGGILWVMWATEAGIVVALSTVLAWRGIQGRVYCETVGEWCRAWKPMWLSFPEEEGMLTEICAGSVEPLAALKTVDGSVYPRLSIVVHEGPGSGATHVWQVSVVQTAGEKAGPRGETTMPLTGKFFVSDEDLERLRLVAGRTPMASARAAGPDVPLLE